MKEKLLALAAELENDRPDIAEKLREIALSSEEKSNENTSTTDEEDGEGGNGGNHPPGDPGKP